MQTISIPAGAGVTIRIEANTVGVTEAKAPAPVEIAVRSAVGLQPLYKVQYLSAAGNLATYGVFWEGPSKFDKSVKSVGLRTMLKSGARMTKRTRYNRGFFVNADKCTVVR